MDLRKSYSPGTDKRVDHMRSVPFALTHSKPWSLTARASRRCSITPSICLPGIEDWPYAWPAPAGGPRQILVQERLLGRGGRSWSGWRNRPLQDLRCRRVIDRWGPAVL